jgi:hypothetical protein
MIEIVMEYVVKKESQGFFELAFGPGGAWSNLYSWCPGYRGTTVLRDLNNPLRYLVFDLWGTETQYTQAMTDNEVPYAELVEQFKEWTDSVIAQGSFRIQSEATIRPRKTGSNYRTGPQQRRRGRAD